MHESSTVALVPLLAALCAALSLESRENTCPNGEAVVNINTASFCCPGSVINAGAADGYCCVSRNSADGADGADGASGDVDVGDGTDGGDVGEDVDVGTGDDGQDGDVSKIQVTFCSGFPHCSGTTAPGAATATASASCLTKIPFSATDYSSRLAKATRSAAATGETSTAAGTTDSADSITSSSGTSRAAESTGTASSQATESGTSSASKSTAASGRTTSTSPKAVNSESASSQTSSGGAALPMIIGGPEPWVGVGLAGVMAVLGAL